MDFSISTMNFMSLGPTFKYIFLKYINIRFQGKGLGELLNLGDREEVAYEYHV